MEIGPRQGLHCVYSKALGRTTYQWDRYIGVNHYEFVYYATEGHTVGMVYVRVNGKYQWQHTLFVQGGKTFGLWRR